ncbi:hypothetical protein TRIUR3_02829 [Triticum urartu]|uniref:Wall-associated receptor kinase galacturonan-binding domain-containing protein n=1 Tax=Triticum urartu TaxID=4572 RepID=M8AK31_TRIUA|nr:hypothetical protein TRIUR3_02829 [Triticum urartu]
MDPFHVSAAAMFFSAMLLLTLLSGITASAQETTTSSLLSTSCEPAMCGSLRIEYPFWLGGTHPPECGYWAFQVSCHSNGTASLKNSIWTYQILEISYPDSTFRVTNSQLSDGTCDFELRVNASSELGLAPFSISAANHQLFFLYNCTEQQARQPPPTWAHVNCANGSLNNSFALLAGNYKPDDKWEPENCTVSMMPVLGYPGATGANYNRLIKGGFRLEYTAGDCTSCRETGGLCRINTTYDIFECRCSDGVSDLIICHSSVGSLHFSPNISSSSFFLYTNRLVAGVLEGLGLTWVTCVRRYPYRVFFVDLRRVTARVWLPYLPVHPRQHQQGLALDEILVISCPENSIRVTNL